MDIQNWNGKKKAFIILSGLLIVVGLIVTVFLVQRVQEIRSRAVKATTLTLTPPNQDALPGQEAKLNVILNPGSNQVSIVKFTIKVDPEKFDPSLVTFIINPDSPLQALNDSSFSNYKEDGNVTFTLITGSDVTKVVREQTTLGELVLPVRDDASGGVTDVIFNEEQSQIRSTQSDDSYNENVLSSTVPARVTITAVCIPNVATCSWDVSRGATSYHYVVTDVDKNIIVKKGDVDSSITGIEFPSKPGITYKCEVTAVNVCAESDPSEGVSTCQVPSPTPSPTLSATPTPTGSPTPTSTPTPVPSNSPTPSPTTPDTTNTPTPTTPQSVVSTPTPTDVNIAISTPIPTLPPTGNPFVVTGLVGGFLFLLGGAALLFL